MDGLAVPADTSAAEELAKALPSGTPVVKAFNATFAKTLGAGEVAGQTLDVFIAGDDEAANRRWRRWPRAEGSALSTSAHSGEPVSSSS
jgi:8-hydroxy-5-deazaflavin:NADPH oxidoreductase